MEAIKLTCPTCGARVEVTEDIDRFACLHCGNEMLVVRRGGTASLKPVLEEVRDGTARTASELAIKRLDGEIKELTLQRGPLAKDADVSGAILLAVLGCTAAAAGVWLYVQDDVLMCCAAPMVIAGVISVGVLLTSRAKVDDARTELQRLDALIEQKQHELRSHKQTVELEGTADEPIPGSINGAEG